MLLFSYQSQSHVIRLWLVSPFQSELWCRSKIIYICILYNVYIYLLTRWWQIMWRILKDMSIQIMSRVIRISQIAFIHLHFDCSMFNGLCPGFYLILFHHCGLESGPMNNANGKCLNNQTNFLQNEHKIYKINSVVLEYFECFWWDRGRNVRPF